MEDHPLVGTYFTHIRNRNADGLAALFTQDAVMILPDGKELTGRDAIHGMYATLLNTNPPIPAPTAIIDNTRSVAVEIDAQLEDGTHRRTANFFHLTEAGLVHRLSVYKRGDLR